MHHMHKPISDFSMYELDLYCSLCAKKIQADIYFFNHLMYKHQCTNIVEIACTCIPVDVTK